MMLLLKQPHTHVKVQHSNKTTWLPPTSAAAVSVNYHCLIFHCYKIKLLTAPKGHKMTLHKVQLEI